MSPRADEDWLARKIAREHVISMSLTPPPWRPPSVPLYACSCGRWSSDESSEGFRKHFDNEYARIAEVKR